MKSIIAIPARYGSSRFPGKPLAIIRGKSMLERTWLIAKQVKVDAVVITTDDSRIEKEAKEFGAQVVRTRSECPNGTVRVFEALEQLRDKPEYVLNLQGDAVLTPPHVLQELLDTMTASPDIQIATPATRLSLEKFDDICRQKALGIVGGTLVVFDKDNNALYFSKSPIPYVRTRTEDAPIYRHIGLYAYRYNALAKYLSLTEGPLEKAEGLEQLRALENGIPIRIVVVDYQGRTHWSVDSPEDLEKVVQIIQQEGELVTDGSLDKGKVTIS